MHAIRMDIIIVVAVAAVMAAPTLILVDVPILTYVDVPILKHVDASILMPVDAPTVAAAMTMPLVKMMNN